MWLNHYCKGLSFLCREQSTQIGITNLTNCLNFPRRWQGATYLGEPPVVLGVSEHETGGATGTVLELANEALQRGAQAAARGVELQHRGGPPARERCRQGALFSVPAVHLHHRGTRAPLNAPYSSAGRRGGGGDVAGDEEALREGADGLEEPGELEVAAGAGPPSGDVGMDGMVVNIASMVAGAVTNPFRDGFYQGDKDAPLEAATACTGVYGSGAYPGFAGNLAVDGTTGASYNANGANGRKYLLPALFDPATSTCSTLV